MASSSRVEFAVEISTFSACMSKVKIDVAAKMAAGMVLKIRLTCF